MGALVVVTVVGQRLAEGRIGEGRTCMGAYARGLVVGAGGCGPAEQGRVDDGGRGGYSERRHIAERLRRWTWRRA